jgi:hypothetical protein
MAEVDITEPETFSLLWTCKECYVYQIPPLKNESGHRANDWDVNKWLWSGALKLTAKGNTLEIVLHDPSSGEVFASCPVAEKGSKAVDQVIDSSRYFALRIDDGKGRHAYVGMGFRDRSHAYDFNATMQDHWKGVQRQKEAEEVRLEMESRAASEPLRDLSLKEGETLSIKVNVPGASGKPRAPRPKPAAGGAGGLLPPPPGPGLLAPPPKAGAPASAPAAAAPAAPAAAPSAAAAAPTADDDDFGDFEAPSADADFGGDDGFGDFASAPPGDK